MIEAKVSIDVYGEYSIAAVVSGPNGQATRLAFYKQLEDVGQTADYALDFPTARDMQQWFVANEQTIRLVRMALSR